MRPPTTPPSPSNSTATKWPSTPKPTSPSARPSARSCSDAPNKTLGHRSQFHRHKHTIRVFDVVRKRRAFPEPELLIKLASRFEIVHRSGFQTRSAITAPLRFRNDVLQDGRSD